MTKISLPLTIYNHTVFVYCLEKDDNLGDLLKKEKYPPTEVTPTAGAITFSNWDMAKFFIVFFPDKDKFIPVSYITHEVFHLVSEFLSFLGMRHEDASEEAYAYLNGYLNKQVFDKLTKKGYRIKI